MYKRGNIALTNEAKQLTFRQVISFGLLACLLYGMTGGLRADIGILLQPLAVHTGLSYKDVSLCIAVMQLAFGCTQPFFGLLAARTSNRLVLLLGVLLMAGSLLGMTFAHSFAGLFLSLGIGFGIGAGALAFGLILTSAIYFAGRKNAMMLAGMLNASAGLCGFFLSPLLQQLLAWKGVAGTLESLLLPFALLLPIALFITSRDSQKRGQASLLQENKSWKDVFRNRTFRLLLAGFSTCGFHMVIIESHLFSQFISYGIPAQAASWVFSVYGLATILGALLSGYLSSRMAKGKLLGFYYGFRAMWMGFYLFLLPKTFWTGVLFAIGLGFTGDATVSPTSGLVHEHFFITQAATLMGVLFLGHQMGAFASAWLGGILVQQTGSYVALWTLDMALCLFASIMSGKIKGDAA